MLTFELGEAEALACLLKNFKANRRYSGIVAICSVGLNCGMKEPDRHAANAFVGNNQQVISLGCTFRSSEGNNEIQPGSLRADQRRYDSGARRQGYKSSEENRRKIRERIQTGVSAHNFEAKGLYAGENFAHYA